MVAATGIVVRLAAGLLRDKTTDPAVVVVDQEGRYAISLVGGHLGGANDLAGHVAGILGGQAVITTATDGAGKPSLEMAAQEAGMVVENLKALSRISRGLLEGETVRVYDPDHRLRPALEAWEGLFDFLSEPPDPADGTHLVWVGYQDVAWPATWLLIRPLVLAVGLGCNRGTALEELEGLMEESFTRCWSINEINQCFSQHCRQTGRTGVGGAGRKTGKKKSCFFPWTNCPEWRRPIRPKTVKKHMGVGSVCEAAALLAAKSRRLLVTKQKSANATLAVALAD